MLLLWAVNALVLKWPVHFQETPGYSKASRLVRYKSFPSTSTDTRMNGPQLLPKNKHMPKLEKGYQSEKVRQLSVE